MSRPTYVMRWDGAAFIQVGTSLEEAVGVEAAGGAYAMAADLKLDASGTPYIVWRNKTHLYLQRWSGTRWEVLASRDAAGTPRAHEQVSLVIVADGRVYIAWAHRPAEDQAEVRVEVWDGTSLEPVLTGLPGFVANSVTLALDAYGRPMVAWLSPSPAGQNKPGLQIRVNH